LLSLKAEKEGQIDSLRQQIITVSQRLDEEIWRLIVQSNPRLTNETEFFVDYENECPDRANPIGYCVDDTLSKNCMFCYVPEPTAPDEALESITPDQSET
jgi:hypothetical protein